MLVAAWLVLVTAPARADVVNRIVASVDGDPITLYELNQYETKQQALLPNVQSLSEKDALQALITEKLLAREIASKGIHVRDEDIDRYIDHIKGANHLDTEQLKAALTVRTKLVMLNSPCNPTGTVYTRGEHERLVEVIFDTKAGILSDEIYEQLCYGDAKPTCLATLRPGLAERTITISGASKSYAMTGWRMGWAVAPLAVAKAMADIQSQETSCPSRPRGA